jgi:L-alanine-DL-glutamate epimerase-like enolase superfamily enzyme
MPAKLCPLSVPLLANVQGAPGAGLHGAAVAYASPIAWLNSLFFMHDTRSVTLPGPVRCGATQLWERLRARWRCRARWAHLPVASGPWYPSGAAAHRVLVLCFERVECAGCEDEAVLWGELNPWPMWGTETWAQALELWTGLCQPGLACTGAELLRRVAASGYRASRSAVERAFGYCWPQAAGKAVPQGLAVTALLGGSADWEAEALAEAGWRSFKLKIRPGSVSFASLERCLGRCMQACKDTTRLRWILDANGTLTQPEWHKWQAWGQACPVDLAIEQPLPVGQEVQAVQAQEGAQPGSVQVYWDESAHDPEGLRALLATGRPYGYVIKPAFCPARVQAWVRRAAGCPRWYCSSAFEGPIGLSYTLALAAMQPDEPVGLGTLAYYRPWPYTLAPVLSPWPFTHTGLQEYWQSLEPCEGLPS